MNSFKRLIRAAALSLLGLEVRSIDTVNNGQVKPESVIFLKSV